MPKGVYLRIGSSTRRATEDYVEDLMRESTRITFDEEPIRASIDVLSQDLLAEHYQKKTKTRLLEDKIIMRSHANAEQYHPTVAGALLFSDKPEQFIVEAQVVCTRFAGTEGRDIIQTEAITGPIAKQIETSFNLVKAWLKRDYHLLGVKMQSRTLVPEEALREAIINAVIHRKYWIPGATKIAMYDERLEVFSPGNFPGHVNLNNLGDGITHLRNPILGRMAHKMRIVEKLGTGIRLILDSCKQAKIKSPEFKEDGDYVKIVFFFSPAVDHRQSDEEILIELLRMKPVVSIHEMTEHLGRSKNTVFKTLNQLIQRGKIKRIGKGRATRYTAER